MADYDIFREQLAIKYPAYGHALWEPSSWKPDSLDKSVEVGDVGFIRNGRFHSLFNALRSADEQSNVPEYHEKLVLKVSDHISTGSLSSNHYCSAGINVEPEPEYHASSPDDFRQVSFRYPRKRGAAVLSLPVKARREDTLVGGYFGAWIVKNIDRWFAFAKELGLIEQMEEIILVTGCDHTRSWSNVAFFGNEYNAHATFGVRVVHGPAISIEWQSSPEHVQGAVLHRGPDGTNLPEDQCVFIRGFRVARTFRILPKHLKAAGSPSPDSDSYGSEPDVEAVSIAATSKYRDPLHILLDYIAERAPDCDMFLIHDDDLKRIDGLDDGTSLEALQPDVVTDLLRKSNIEIHCDLSHTSHNPNSNTEVVRVAMFSNPTPHLWTPPAAPVLAGSSFSLPTTGQLRKQPSPPDATTPSSLVTVPHSIPPVPTAATSPSQPNSPLDPHPHPSQLLPPPLHLQSQASRLVDDISKPLDRRLFLQQGQLPSPKHDGLDRGSISTGKSLSETEELRPSSVASNQTRASTATASSCTTSRNRQNPSFRRRSQNLTSRRRSKNSPFRPSLTRLNSGRHLMQEMRKDLTRVHPPPQHSEDKAPKAAGPSRPARSPVESHPQTEAQTCQMNSATSPQASNAHATASAASRRGIVSNFSSEYETTDTEGDYDDSCASEGVSEGSVDAAGPSTVEHPPTKEEIRPREAALEAQRQREQFIKQPKRSSVNLGRARTFQTDSATAPQAPASVVPRSRIVSKSSSDFATDTQEWDSGDSDDDFEASKSFREGAVDAAGTSAGKHPQTKEEIELREAALEAQRQRELFVKQPKQSYSNLGRTQSGLLSQLLNPDPDMFPPGRRVASDHDVTRTTGIPSTLTSGKSRAVLPLAAQATKSSSRGGYRLKGRPQLEELEDESDSFDDPDNSIQHSPNSVQQRLTSLAAAKSSRRRASDNQVPTTQTSAMTVATAPMPLNHPWNLPAPEPPATPRTTRRQMLAAELSESLRRNLLWERQVSQTNLVGIGGLGVSSLAARPKAVADGDGNAPVVPSQQQQQQQHGQGSGDEAQESIAERRQRVLTRDRTWSDDDFHHAGW